VHAAIRSIAVNAQWEVASAALLDGAAILRRNDSSFEDGMA
jgi:hypothetical protein